MVDFDTVGIVKLALKQNWTSSLQKIGKISKKNDSYLTEGKGIGNHVMDDLWKRVRFMTKMTN